jgi:hypothetical protein
VFPPYANTIARFSFLGGLLGGAGVLWVCLVFTRSSYGTGAGIARVQPVPFSHEHHVGVLASIAATVTAASSSPPTPACRPPGRA